MSEKYHIRKMETADQDFIDEMLYQAIFIPEGAPKLPRFIIEKPSLKKYHDDYGKHGDIGFVMVDSDSGKGVGAIWLRLFTEANHGWGFVSAEIPELCMAVDYAYRGQGLGRRLLMHLLEETATLYPDISLSVDQTNYAKSLYKACGFIEVYEEGDSVTMLLRRA